MSFNNFPPHPPSAVLIVVAENPEHSYLGSVGYVRTDAGAGIVIPYTHDTESIRNIVRELTEVHDASSIGPRDELDGYGEIP